MRSDTRISERKNSRDETCDGTERGGGSISMNMWNKE